MHGCERQALAAKLCKVHYDKEMELNKRRKVFSPDITGEEIQILEEKHETTRDEGADR